MMLPYKDEMAGYAAYDVRGYNNLLQEKTLIRNYQASLR